MPPAHPLTPPTVYVEAHDPGYSHPEVVPPSDPRNAPSLPQLVHSEGEKDTAKYAYGAQPASPLSPIEDKEVARQRPTRRTLCGIPLIGVMLIVAFAIIAITGAVGGGVAGSMAAKDCRSELNDLRRNVAAGQEASPSTSATPTSAPQDPVPSAAPTTNCPASNNTFYASDLGTNSTTFLMLCNRLKVGADMFQVAAPSWTSCMDACAEYNAFLRTRESRGTMPPCRGVSWVPEWSVHPEWAYGNYSTRGSCWLKGSVKDLQSEWVVGAEVVTGVMKG